MNFTNALYIGKLIKIIPDGIYQLESSGRDLTQFNVLEIERYENQPSNSYITSLELQNYR
jgi:hypothetical protein